MPTAVGPVNVGPLPAPADRGGDVRFYDLMRAEDVRGPHVFVSSSHIRLTNGLVRLDFAGPGTIPAASCSVWRPPWVTGDALVDTLSDTLGGTNNAGQWVALGTVYFDSLSVVATVNARVVRCSRESASVRLVVPFVNDVFVTLRRGERMARVTHGNDRDAVTSVIRRFRWSDSPAIGGITDTGRVYETTPVYGDMQRFAVAREAVTADGSAFSLTTTAALTTASFGFGVALPGLANPLDNVVDHHAQFLGTTKSKMRRAG